MQSHSETVTLELFKQGTAYAVAGGVCYKPLRRATLRKHIPLDFVRADAQTQTCSSCSTNDIDFGCFVVFVSPHKPKWAV